MIEVTSEMIISGFVSKVVNDLGDILKNKIRDADKNRRTNGQTIETRIYQVIVDALNEFPYNEYKKDEKVYDAAESILKQFKSHENDYKEAIGVGLRIIVSQVTSSICEEFLKKLCDKICQNDILYREILLIYHVQEREAINRGFREGHQNEEEELKILNGIKEDTKYIRESMSSEVAQTSECHNRISIENRAEEYFKKWDKNVFLNNFNERDENPGVNVKLRSIYLEKHLPHYIWKSNRKSSHDLKKLLEEYIIDNDDKKMLLILGQPGIGKSTLITWIMANFIEKKDDIYVYQFASDLKDINWQGNDILDNIFETLGLNDKLENKVLILDGFDEIHANSDRERILNQIYQKLKGMNYLKQFSLVITCRKNYIHKLQRVGSDYITLQAWDEEQISSFCGNYGNVCKKFIPQITVNSLLSNKEILGIPLILYMVLALDISIGQNNSLGDIYDKIFSLEGGIYDRCINNLSYGDKPRISRIKKQIHQVSQRIAFWIFENEPDETFITKDKYEEICDDIINETSEEYEDIKRDVLISNYFEPIKHCEGIGTDELQFVHRSIYEYFVAVYFYESIYKLTSKEAVAGKLGELLKDGHLSEQLLVFIKYKFDSIKRCNLASETKAVFNMMLQDGMTYHIGTPCKNAIEREGNIFSNMLKVVSLWNPSLGALDKRIAIYLQYNRKNELNLRGVDLSKVKLIKANLIGANLIGANLSGANLSGAYLIEANLSGAYLNGANLSGANLSGANLMGAYLIEANLIGANLIGANLREANLIGANLRGVNLRGADVFEVNLFRTIFDECQVDLIGKKYDLTDSQVYISETDEIISYKEYCMRKKGV